MISAFVNKIRFQNTVRLHFFVIFHIKLFVPEKISFFVFRSIYLFNSELVEIKFVYIQNILINICFSDKLDFEVFKSVIGIIIKFIKNYSIKQSCPNCYDNKQSG